MSKKGKLEQNTNYVQLYNKLMKDTPILIVNSTSTFNNLQQPSLLKNVDSITTYEVTSRTREND
ncbi:TPA: hypothetical protein ACT9LS_002114 [Legionella pneumophila]|nr:hypothetical protein [Legionella pneumophila]HAU0773263.1 hypothetical protein [Legionella pneumophila]HAU0871351.1 hypothetical protein [Legionella pneumophila]HAU0889663.1 hypothetical protein [Legionella pneumophila]HAU1699116.1 hypothetical protein [Legionella pneumophila]